MACTYPPKHKPNTPVEAPSADECRRPLPPRSATLLCLCPPSPQHPSAKGTLSRSSPDPPPLATKAPWMPVCGPLRLFRSLLSLGELPVHRPLRCSDGDRPYLTASALPPPPRAGEGRGEPARALERWKRKTDSWLNREIAADGVRERERERGRGKEKKSKTD